MEKKNSNQDDLNIKLNGDQNLGRLIRFILDENLKSKYHSILMGIGRMSIGYCQPIALRKNKTGMTIPEWADFIGIGKTKFKEQIKELQELGYVTIIPGSHFRQDGGSYPNTYGINFQKTKEKNIYFNLEGIKLTNFKEEKQEKITEKKLSYEDLLGEDNGDF